MQFKMHVEMQFSTFGICDLYDYNFSYLCNGWVNAMETKFKHHGDWLLDFYFYILIAVKKSCSDTGEKCVFMENSRDVAMDLENPLKLTTEGRYTIILVFYLV